MWAVLSGQTKKSAPAERSRLALVARMDAIGGRSPASQAGML
jgi:hypothetical protein